VTLGYPVERTSGPGERARREREPGDEGEAPRGAGVEHILGTAVLEVEAVLDRDDLGERLGAVELLDADVRNAEVADLALVAQLDQRPERLLERDVRVDGVQLQQVDSLDVESLEAAVDGLEQMIGVAVAGP
jgi:hypothetical protein